MVIGLAAVGWVLSFAVASVDVIEEAGWLKAYRGLFDSTRGYPGEGPPASRRLRFDEHVLRDAMAEHGRGNLLAAAQLVRRRNAPRWLVGRVGRSAPERVVQWYTVAGLHASRTVPTHEQWTRFLANLRQVDWNAHRVRPRGAGGVARAAALGPAARSEGVGANAAMDVDSSGSEAEPDDVFAGAPGGGNDDVELFVDGHRSWLGGQFEDPLEQRWDALAEGDNWAGIDDVHVQADPSTASAPGAILFPIVSSADGLGLRRGTIDIGPEDTCCMCLRLELLSASARLVGFDACGHVICLSCAITYAGRDRAEGVALCPYRCAGTRGFVSVTLRVGAADGRRWSPAQLAACATCFRCRRGASARPMCSSLAS